MLEKELGEEAGKNPGETYMPASRADAVGDLAWRLLGPHDGLPDFTAAVPLFDALVADGDIAGAHRLRDAVISIYVSSQNIDLANLNPRNRVARLGDLKSRLVMAAMPYLFDLASVAGILGVLTQTLARKDEVKETESKVKTARVPVPERARKGRRVVIDEHRTGVMVSSRYPDGTADVLVEDDSEEESAYPGDIDDGVMEDQGKPLGMQSVNRLDRDLSRFFGKK